MLAAGGGTGSACVRSSSEGLRRDGDVALVCVGEAAERLDEGLEGSASRSLEATEEAALSSRAGPTTQRAPAPRADARSPVVDPLSDLRGRAAFDRPERERHGDRRAGEVHERLGARRKDHHHGAAWAATEAPHLNDDAGRRLVRAGWAALLTLPDAVTVQREAVPTPRRHVACRARRRPRLLDREWPVFDVARISKHSVPALEFPDSSPGARAEGVSTPSAHLFDPLAPASRAPR